jgi:GTPase
LEAVCWTSRNFPLCITFTGLLSVIFKLSFFSTLGNDILGFDSVGNVVNQPDHGNLDWVKICEQSAKVITFIDLAGHERYLKTTVFGMTGEN